MKVAKTVFNSGTESCDVQSSETENSWSMVNSPRCHPSAVHQRTTATPIARTHALRTQRCIAEGDFGCQLMEIGILLTWKANETSWLRPLCKKSSNTLQACTKGWDFPTLQNDAKIPGMNNCHHLASPMSPLRWLLVPPKWTVWDQSWVEQKLECPEGNRRKWCNGWMEDHESVFLRFILNSYKKNLQYL